MLQDRLKEHYRKVAYEPNLYHNYYTTPASLVNGTNPFPLDTQSQQMVALIFESHKKTEVKYF